MLAGCAGSAAPTDPTAPAGDTRTITHGTPQRVGTIGLTEQDYVLALGVVPVGVLEWFGEQPGALWPWAARAAGDAPTPEVLPVLELNYQQIAALARTSSSASTTR